MLKITAKLLILLLVAVTPLINAASIHLPRAQSADFEIVKPEADYKVPVPEPYHDGATADIPFQVKGEAGPSGYVRVLLKSEQKGVKDTVIAKHIPYKDGYAEAPITVLLNHLGGDYDFVVNLYDDNDKKIGTATQKINIPKEPKKKGKSAEKEEASATPK